MKDFQKLLNDFTKFITHRLPRFLLVGKLLLVPFPLFILYLGLQVALAATIQDIATLSLSPVSVFEPGFYPVMRGVLGVNESRDDDNKLASISANAYVVMNNDTKVIIASKNPEVTFPMASTTKIMTALTALAHFDLADILTVISDDAQGSVVGLTIGDQFLFKDLLYAMLLPSGNDAANTISDNYPGGRSAFIRKMNENVKKFHLTHTNFSDPSGLAETNYTTAIDLARLSSLAIQHKDLATIFNTKHKTIYNISRTKPYSLTNLNKLLGFDGIDGIKTGFTDEASGVLTTSQEISSHRFIIVVMKSKDRFVDTQTLLHAITNNVTFLDLSP